MFIQRVGFVEGLLLSQIVHLEPVYLGLYIEVGLSSWVAIKRAGFNNNICAWYMAALICLMHILFQGRAVRRATVG